MKRSGIAFSLLAAGIGAAASCTSAAPADKPADALPTVRLRPAPDLKFPSHTDSNSPAHWDGDTFYLFNSVGRPMRSFGPDLFHLGAPAEATYDNKANGGRWVECIWKEEGGTLYGWYHLEPTGVCPNKKSLTAPKIGAVTSKDNGATWHDLGVVLEAPGPLVCDTPNHYFAGGNGDFCAMPDAKREFVYLFISTYHKDTAEQGVSCARMRYADRENPVGKVWKWRQGKWEEPGIGGKVTPIFPVAKDWHLPDCDTYWGPSIHWNTHLNLYVMLINRAMNKAWDSEGFYVSFNREVGDPEGWSKPVKVADRSDLKGGQRWYPQVVGTAKGESDKLAGKVARFFLHGESRWEAVFLKPGEKE